MELHTCMLTALADDIAVPNCDRINIVLSPYFGLNQADFDELVVIMAKRHPRISLSHFCRLDASNHRP